MVDAIVFTVIWVVLSAAGEIWLRGIHSHTLYFIIAKQGLLAERAFNFLATFLLPVFVFVVLILLFALLRFRAPDKTPVKSARQAVQNRWFVGIWVTVSFAINILFWLHPTAADLEQMFAKDSPSANKHDVIVDVTARQWEWIFSYPQYGITQSVNAKDGQDELVLPVNRRVEFVLRTYDPFHAYDVYAGVIHSFWIPAFGIKEDLIPGETRYEFITPIKTANYQTNPMVRVQCAEVCGPGHPWMEAPVSIVSAQKFKNWIKYEKKLEQG